MLLRREDPCRLPGGWSPQASPERRQQDSLPCLRTRRKAKATMGIEPHPDGSTQPRERRPAGRPATADPAEQSKTMTAPRPRPWLPEQARRLDAGPLEPLIGSFALHLTAEVGTGSLHQAHHRNTGRIRRGRSRPGRRRHPGPGPGPGPGPAAPQPLPDLPAPAPFAARRRLGATPKRRPAASSRRANYRARSQERDNHLVAYDLERGSGLWPAPASPPIAIADRTTRPALARRARGRRPCVPARPVGSPARTRLTRSRSAGPGPLPRRAVTGASQRTSDQGSGDQRAARLPKNASMPSW